MALPSGNSGDLWPPKTMDPILFHMFRWAAWYSGDPEKLGAIFGTTGQDFGSLLNRPSQYRTGMLGSLSRFWWGRPAHSGNDVQEIKLHIPVAGDIASMSSDMLFAEFPSISVRDAGAATQDRLETEHLDDLLLSIREAAEEQSALGGVYLRGVWDQEVSDKPWIQPVSPDNAVPEWSFGKLKAVTFWDVIEDSVNGKVVRHLERHETGRILHGVYEGTQTELGRLKPLADFEATAPFADAITSDGDTIDTGLDRLTAIYVPNVRPNRLWRDVPAGRNHGRSDYAGIEQAMDRLDMVWSSWMRDIRLGLARVIVDQSALMSDGPGQGASFDIDRELLVGLRLGISPDTQPLTQIQFAIRTEDHKVATQSLLEQIVRGAGYSMQTFSGETDGGAQTATEIAAKEKRTLTTRDRKIAYWTQGLKDAVRLLLDLDRTVFGAQVSSDIDPDVDFPDAVSDPPEIMARTIKTLDEAKAISTEIKIRTLHPDWDDKQIAAEIEAIEGMSRMAQTAGIAATLGQAQSLGAIDQNTTDTVIQRLSGGQPQ